MLFLFVMVKKILVFGILAFIILIVAYGGLVIYGNVKALNESPYSMPDSNEAQYAIQIENTGNYLLSNDMEQHGDIVILHGYWELVGQKFKYREGEIVLNQQIFGEIKVIRR